MKLYAAISVALLGLGATQRQASTVPYTDIGGRITVLGRFGSPLGTYLVLSGHREGTAIHNAMNVAGDFKIERVNGVKIKDAVMLWVDEVAAFPNGTACTLRGYESGGMIGIPSEVTKKEGGSGSQTPWHFETQFMCVRATKGW